MQRMSRFLIPLLMLATLSPARAARFDERMLQDGDIVFHESRSSQSRAIQLATHSRYSHMGILWRQHGRWFVYEAVQPVKLTPLSDWIARGAGEHFVVKRLRDRTVLSPAVLARMHALAESYRGRPYDLYFEWSDDRIYCSELVWKVYKLGAGVEIGRLQRLGDFDLSAREVRAQLRERYGAHVPLNEPVVSPAAMFDSPNLIEVASR